MVYKISNDVQKTKQYLKENNDSSNGAVTTHNMLYNMYNILLQSIIQTKILH